jgi:hypothetical protein
MPFAGKVPTAGRWVISGAKAFDPKVREEKHNRN